MEHNAPLAALTSFHIGGPAETLAWPAAQEQLAGYLRSGEVSLILGGGSNLLVSDRGVRGVTLGLAKGFSEIRFTPAPAGIVTAHVQGGAQLGRLVAEAYKRSLSGLEFAMGIPGTVGGALIMNAGARDNEMKDIADSVTVMTPDGKMVEMKKAECGFGYRSSSFPKGSVIVDCALKLKEGVKEEIHIKMRKNQLARKASQPLDLPSAGSVYKNPPGEYAGHLLETAGMKGYTVGGARVAEKHANFIVNLGWARAADVVAVMEEAERRVYSAFGVKLEREIRLAGEF